MKKLKLLLLISVIYSIAITTVIVTSNCEDRFEQLVEDCIKAEDEHLRIKHTMTNELFELRQKYRKEIDSLERQILSHN
jgi:hypothetical protein